MGELFHAGGVWMYAVTGLAAGMTLEVIRLGRAPRPLSAARAVGFGAATVLTGLCGMMLGLFAFGASVPVDAPATLVVRAFGYSLTPLAWAAFLTALNAAALGWVVSHRRDADGASPRQAPALRREPA